MMKNRFVRSLSIILVLIMILAVFVACGQGKEGPAGAKGDKGEQGEPGVNGTNGVDGKSAYELAVDKGYTGTVEEWLASLVGEVGATGQAGTNGQSAYEIAEKNGYTGTEIEWLASLVGAKGEDGKNGTNGTNGINGVSVVNAYVDDNLHLWIVLSNGTKIDAGYVGVTVDPSPVTYIVTFVDYNGTVLKTETVNSDSSATPPASPTREGYEFKYWSGIYTNVTSNQTVTAVYEEIAVGDKYTVTFVDYDGTTVLGSDMVVSGGTAKLPINPERNGYIFAGWEGTYKNITSDQTVQANYVSEDASNIFLIDSAEANVGDTFTVELNLTGTVKLLTFDMCVCYDTSVLEVVSFDDQEVTINHLENEGMFVLNHSQDKNRTKDKYLTEITFRVKDGVSVSGTEIYISNAKDIVYVNDGGTYSAADYELVSGWVRIQ